MKNMIFFVSALLITRIAVSNDTLYYSVLKNSIETANMEYSLENFRQLANTGERIMLLYKTEWLPRYYVAYALINMSFIEQNEGSKELYCDKAQQLLDEALKIRSVEPELYVLQALLYFGRMGIRPMINGPLYFPKATSALNEAEKLDPCNPRIYYLRGKSALNTPKFLGGGKDTAAPMFEKAISLFNEYKIKSSIHPDWGRNDTERLWKLCMADTTY